MCILDKIMNRAMVKIYLDNKRMWIFNVCIKAIHEKRMIYVYK